MNRTKLYNIWANMKSRCNNRDRKDSKHYHDKGITYCAEWELFHGFEKWAMLNGYQEGLSLDRKSGDGNYEPGNCRFVSLPEQQRNKSNNIVLEYNGESMTLQEWSRRLNINRATLKSRLDLGYSVKEAFEKRTGVLRTSPLYDYKGQMLSLSQLAVIGGMSKECLHRRIKDGWRIEDAVGRPLMK